MQIFSTPLLFPQLTRLMTNKQVSYVTGYIYAFLLLLNPLAALANRSHVIWQWIVILFSYGLSQCFRFFFVTYPCQQRALSLATLPSFHERHGVHHQQHLSGLPRQSQRTRPSHVRLRPLCGTLYSFPPLSPPGPLGVLQRLRVVVQERTELPVRLRMCVLCGSSENEVICSSSPWCRPSTRRSPPCCPSP